MDKVARLTDRRDFLRVQNEGRRFRAKHIAVLAHPTPNASLESPPRVGFTVSRKVGNAVIRNRVRRWLRELTRLHGPCLSPSFDYVVIAYPEAAGAGFVLLGADLAELFKRAGAMGASS